MSLSGNTTKNTTGATGNVHGNVENVAPVQDREIITDGTDSGKWSAIDDATVNITDDAKHILGSKSIEFDKVAGTANTLFAIIQRTDLDLDLSRFLPDDELYCLFSVSSIANIAEVNIRFGFDDRNYTEFTLDDSAISAGVWQEFEIELRNANFLVKNDGADWANIKYCAFVVEFDTELNTLTDILLDCIYLKSKE